jgi:hypothetical protein
MGSLLDEIDDILNDGDVVVNCSYEIENAINEESIKNIKKMSSHSTKYSILKKGRSSNYKNVNDVSIYSIPWECESVLKYFDMDDIYKGAEFVMKEYVINYNSYIHNSVEFYVIFRGHNKKKDNAVLICQTINTRSLQDTTRTAFSNVIHTFNNENKFNALMNRVRHYLKMDGKIFKFLKH